MPLTASVPMSPPGKNERAARRSESVVKASRSANGRAPRRRAARSSIGLSKAGRKTVSRSRRISRAAAAMRKLDDVAMPRPALGSDIAKSFPLVMPPPPASRSSGDSGNRPRRRPPTRPSVAPSGRSGVQRVPKAGQSSGLRSALQDEAADALRLPARRAVSTLRTAARRRSRDRRRAEPRPLCAISPMPRHGAGRLEDLAITSCAAAVSFAANRSAYWFSTSAAALLELAHAHVDALAEYRAARSR